MIVIEPFEAVESEIFDPAIRYEDPSETLCRDPVIPEEKIAFSVAWTYLKDPDFA